MINVVHRQQLIKCLRGIDASLISMKNRSVRRASLLVVSYISRHEKWDKEVGRKNGENVAKIHGRIQEKRREPVLKREDTSAAM